MQLTSGDGRRGTRIDRRALTRVAAATVVVLAVLLALAQLLFPGIAAQRVRDRIRRYGTVHSVQVSALPAIEMLWGRIDSLDVKAGRLQIPLPQTANLLSSARGVSDLNVAASQADLTAAGLGNGGLLLRDVTLQKRGGALQGEAVLLESDLRAALPAGWQLQPVASGGGAVQVRASGALFGVSASVEGVVAAQEGKLVLEPVGFPLANLVHLTLFSDPRIAIEAVGARPRSGGYQLRIDARAS